MEIKFGWQGSAKTKRDELIAADPKLRGFFAATERSIRNGEIGLPKEGTAEVRVEFTIYKLVLDIDTDRIARVKYIDVTGVK